MAAGKFVPGVNGKDCAEKAGGWGLKSSLYDYIWKGDMDQSKYPEGACPPRYHGNAQIDNLRVNVNIDGFGKCTFPTFYGNLVGNVTGFASGNKAFDISHPRTDGKRIRHICAEGPEPGIYIRGKLKNSNEIELPEYWDGLIDPESITVTLTQIGYSQDLIVESIDSGKIVKIKSGIGADINCYYEIWAARYVNPKDHSEKLHVVYDGETPNDYPGDNDGFLIGGWALGNP